MAKGALVNYDEVHKKSLRSAAHLFLKQGYTSTSIRMIAKDADVGLTSMLRVFGSKEGILCELVKFVLEGQFNAAKEMLSGVTDDPLLYYAAETTLQLYMAESDEAIRDLYSAAYYLPESSELIRRAVSEKLLGVVFRAYLPNHTAEDFYELEIASGGMIQGYMAVPCTPEFTMDKKVRRFLEASLPLYGVPGDKVREAVEFVKRFDYPPVVKKTVDRMFSHLEDSL